MTLQPEQLVDRVARALGVQLPAGISAADLNGFLRRKRPALIAIAAEHLAQQREGRASSSLPEAWTPARRTEANLAAMRLAARTPPERMTEANRRELAGYSGWGGLSIDAVKDQFPDGFPVPDRRGLIHEYYTPTAVTDEVARVLRPLIPALAGPDGTVLALEPSAGIGRFVRSLSGPGFEALQWLVVEWSVLSARMLAALRPDLAVYQGPFERWVRERGADYTGRIGLVVANPLTYAMYLCALIWLPWTVTAMLRS